MKHLKVITGTLIGIALGSGITIKLGTLNPPNTDEIDKKHLLMADYVWLSARLKQDPVIDLSIGDSLEWSQAYVDALQQQNVPPPVDLATPNLNTMLQLNAASKSMICDNPNSTAIKKIAPVVIKKVK